MVKKRISKSVYVPSAVSSFFEICDRDPGGSKIKDKLKVGARGGGFVIARGSKTIAESQESLKHDLVKINGSYIPVARTTLKAVALMRKKFDFPHVKIIHEIEPPIGSGFGTSGSGAVGTVISLSNLFDLHLTLSQASAFAHIAEIESVTGLGTVISIISGCGAIGLVTEPGSYSIGRVDSILSDPNSYVLVCASFGPIEKSTVLHSENLRRKVNKYGKRTLIEVLRDSTPETLLSSSRGFAEKTGIATPELLKLADKAIGFGAIGATQNMIGNSLHCLVEKSRRKKFVDSFTELVPKGSLFESELYSSGPKFID